MLRAAGLTFQVIPPGVEDVMDAEETPDGYVRRMAMAKCDAVRPAAGDHAVLGAATVVIADGRILDRPASEDDARRILRTLSAREHTVMTAVCLSYRAEGARQSRTRVERTIIEVAPLSDSDVEWYVRSGEPMACAGGFSVQGLGSRFARRIHGSHANAMGLPVAAVYELCIAAGMKMT